MLLWAVQRFTMSNLFLICSTLLIPEIQVILLLSPIPNLRKWAPHNSPLLVLFLQKTTEMTTRVKAADSTAIRMMTYNGRAFFWVPGAGVTQQKWRFPSSFTWPFIFKIIDANQQGLLPTWCLLDSFWSAIWLAVSDMLWKLLIITRSCTVAA